MKRTLLLALAILLLLWAGLFVHLKWAGRMPLRSLLPERASLYLELRGVEPVWKELRLTRAYAHWRSSPSAAALDVSPAMKLLDAALAQVNAATGLSLGREDLLDLVGREAALAVYGDPGGAERGAPPAFAAGFRLRHRAWGLGQLYRIWDRWIGRGSSLERERYRGAEILSWETGSPVWPEFAALTRGELLVVTTGRELARGAVDCLAGEEAPLGEEPSLLAVDERLQGEGQVFFWSAAASELLAGTRGQRLAPFGLRLFLGQRSRLEAFAFAGLPRGKSPAGGLAGRELLRFLPDDPVFLLAQAGPPLPRLAPAVRDALSRSGLPPRKAVEAWGMLLLDFDESQFLPQPRWAYLFATPGEETARRLSETVDLPSPLPWQAWGRPRPQARGRHVLVPSDEGTARALAGAFDGGGEAPPSLRELLDGGEGETVALALLDGERAWKATERFLLPLAGLLGSDEGGASPARELELLRTLLRGTARVDRTGEGFRAVLDLKLRDL